MSLEIEFTGKPLPNSLETPKLYRSETLGDLQFLIIKRNISGAFPGP